MMFRAFLLWCLIALCVPAAGARAETVSVDASRDGLIARLSVEAGRAALAWRYDRPLPAPLQMLSAEFNGRALAVSGSRAYPDGADRTAVMFLLDVTGGEPREEALFRAKARLLRSYDFIGEHHVVALGAIDGGVRLVLPTGDAAPDPIAAMLALRLSEQTPDLGAAIAFATDVTASAEATRRAIFIFTDGHSETAVEPDALIAAARAAEVSVNFLIDPGERPADLPALQRIASETGGLYAAGDEISRVVEAPFAYVDSGAYAEIPLSSIRLYPWEQEAVLTVAFRYGDATLSLRSVVEAQPASVRETARYLWQNHGREIAVASAAGGWAIAVVGLTVAGSYRRRARRAMKALESGAVPTEPPDASPPAPAEIAGAETVTAAAPEDPERAGQPAAAPADGTAGDLAPDERSIADRAQRGALPGTALPEEDGESEDGDEERSRPGGSPAAEDDPATLNILRLYRPDGSFADVVLEGECISVGRSGQNDIVLGESTVSSRQAVFLATPEGGYEIENLSQTNPSRVNGAVLFRQPLQDGDRLDLGEVRGEFISRPGRREEDDR